MKAGIITFHDANNYGAVLQAYALNKKIGEYCSSEIINYHNEKFHKSHSTSGIKNKIINLIYRNAIKKKNKEFSEFRKNKLLIKGDIIRDEQLSQLNDIFDVFISGSDQVWNLKCSGNNDSYFLNFVNDTKKKNSYSASFGTREPKLDEMHIKYIKEFNHISVRERSGKDYLSEININAVKTCDPVFLLDKGEWDKLAGDNSDRYILVYEVVNGVNMINFAKMLSKVQKLKVIVITSSYKPILSVKTLRDIGPIKWLNLIKNAEYIITNSFHGLAFSLIFNKQFFVELLSNSDSNARMIELLEDMNLSSRLISDWQDIVKLDNIEFDNVNKKIKEVRKESIEYIGTIIRRKRKK